MKVLFLGWEFPPHSVGGLGTHSYNLVRALAEKGIQMSVILPFRDYTKIDGIEFITFEGSSFASVYSLGKGQEKKDCQTLYMNVFNEVEEYRKKAVELSSKVEFDVIHANDWVTGRAAIEIKKKSGKKLVTTIHSTEYDRTAGNPWEEIAKEEKSIIDNSDIIVTVSRRLRDEIIRLYGVNENKIKIIYNAIERGRFNSLRKNQNRRIVLYVGRLSVQKGVDRLIMAFKTVIERRPDALLYIVGEGQEMPNLIRLSIDLGLADKVIFLGRAPDEDREFLYSIANVFVMPSVSEPFGIVALEAIASNVPTIVSLQSGVSEVIRNVLKVDFWDVQQMADMIIGLMEYGGINEELSKEAYRELNEITWGKAAEEFVNLYS